MKTTEEEKMLSIMQDLMGMRYGWSFAAQQAWTFSVSYIASYLNEHAAQSEEAVEAVNGENANETGDGKGSEVATFMAAGRLDWLLRSTRPSLNGLLSEKDVATLLNCYRGEMFFPGQFECLASDLCDHRGVGPKTYKTSSIAGLVEKLLKLSPIQRVTLADALEQTWHRGMKQEDKSPKEFFATLGIELT